MREWILRGIFAAIGILHLLPALGLLGRETLQRTYGIFLADANLVLLMRHRAVLFGILAAACFTAIVRSDWRMPIAIAAWLSMASFVALFLLEPGATALRRIFLADVCGLVPISVAIAMLWKRS
jgi:hypothetical protein